MLLPLMPQVDCGLDFPNRHPISSLSLVLSFYRVGHGRVLSKFWMISDAQALSVPLLPSFSILLPFP
jgi:hypothetical protein